jgi:hypothetical protein
VVRHVEGAHGHAVLGQRAGLVGADHAHRAERLDGGQPADERPALEHAPRAERQREGDHGGQACGHDGDGDRDGGQQQVADLVPAQNADPKDERRDPGPDQGQHHPQLVQPALEGGTLRADLLDQPGDAAQLGVHAGGDHQPAPAPGGDDRPQVGHVAPVAERQVMAFERVRELPHRFGFARQRGFLDLQVDRFQQAQVRRDQDPRLELDDIAGDELAGGKLAQFSIPDGPDLWHGHLLERGDGLPGAVLLNESQHGVQDDDGQDGDRIFGLAQ